MKATRHTECTAHWTTSVLNWKWTPLCCTTMTLQNTKGDARGARGGDVLYTRNKLVVLQRWIWKCCTHLCWVLSLWSGKRAHFKARLHNRYVNKTFIHTCRIKPWWTLLPKQTRMLSRRLLRSFIQVVFTSILTLYAFKLWHFLLQLNPSYILCYFIAVLMHFSSYLAYLLGVE